MINYPNLLRDLSRLKDDLFTANLSAESQIVVDASKAINVLQLKIETEKQIVLTLSKIIGTLIVDVEHKAQATLCAAKNEREGADHMLKNASKVRSQVVSLDETRRVRS